MNQSIKKIAVTVGVIIVSVGLAMITQKKGEIKDFSNAQIFSHTNLGNEEKLMNPTPIPLLSDSLDSLLCDDSRTYCNPWNIFVSGGDTTIIGDTISFTYYVVGQDSTITALLSIVSDSPSVTRISGPASVSHTFTANDTLSIEYSFLVADTGRHSISLNLTHDSTFYRIPNTATSRIYLLGLEDTNGNLDSVVFTTDTLPDLYFPPDSADGPWDTAGGYPLIMASGTMTGKVVFWDENQQGWVPCRGFVVQSGSCGPTASTGENGNFTLSVPANRDVRIRVRAKTDGGYITKLWDSYLWISEKKNWNGEYYLAEIKDTMEDGSFHVNGLLNDYAWLLNTAHDCHGFCHNHFGWAPPGDPVAIKCPEDGLQFNGFHIKFDDSYTFDDWGRYAFCHEYGHHVDLAEGWVFWGTGTPAGGQSSHLLPDRASLKFAFKEGWPDFFGRAVCWENRGAYRLTDDEGFFLEAENFYSNNAREDKADTLKRTDNSNGFWRDDGKFSALPADSIRMWTDGQVVEGTVLQFLWDLYDDESFYDEDDKNHGYDDENIAGNIEDIWEVFDQSSITIPEYKTKWNQMGKADVEEMYNVICHPSSVGDENYPVDPPINFTATWNETTDAIDLTWDDPPTPNNIGHYMLFYSDEFTAGQQESGWLTGWQNKVELYKWLSADANSKTDTEHNPFKRRAIYLYAIQGRDNDTSYMNTGTVDTAYVPPVSITTGDITDAIPVVRGKIGRLIIPGSSSTVTWAAAIDENTGEVPEKIEIDVSFDGGRTYNNIATENDIGNYDLLGTEVDEEGYTLAYYGYKGEESWTPSSSLKPSAYAQYRYRVILESGDTAVGYSQQNYTLATCLGTQNSTAYISGKQSSGSSLECMVFTNSSNNVVYSQSDDGNEWDTSITIATTGSYPSVGMVNDTAVIAWVNASTNDQSLLQRSIYSPTFGTLVASRGSQAQIISEPSTISKEDTSYTSAFIARGYSISTLNYLSLLNFHKTAGGLGTKIDTLYGMTGASLSPIYCAPAMSVDDEDNLYFSFIYGNKNIFVSKIGSFADVDTVSDSALAWPAIDITEGNVYLTYAKRTPSDSIVLRKWRCVGDTFWRGTDTLFKGSVKGITTSSGVYTLISTQDNEAKLVTYNPLFKTTATEEMADSVYNPHVYLSRLSSKHLAFEWTALSGSNYYVTSHRAECDDILPVIYFKCGAEATPYTTYRNSTRDFGAYSVDCGNDSLVYTLDGLETSLDYNLALEFFYDDTIAAKTFIVTVGSETDTVTVTDSTLTRYNFVIESPDTTMRVKITGTDAVLARLILYESDGSTQGYYSRREEEISDPKPLEFRLDNVMPNPFTKTATISFAIPLAEPVILKVYDVTGREVRTLVNGPVAAGVHSVNWDARDNQARAVASGVYFVRIATKDFKASRKAVLLK